MTHDSRRRRPAEGEFDMAAFLADAAVVVVLRSAKIARGGRAGAGEAWLMVSEKVQATLELQAALLTGRLGLDPRTIARRTLHHLGGKVHANRKRLGG